MSLSDRTPFEALRSALRFAASRSCITGAEELAIMDAWNNTRPAANVEAEPVARQIVALEWLEYDDRLNPQLTEVIASALEQVRKDALEEAAKLADELGGVRPATADQAPFRAQHTRAKTIAAAIRALALKDQANG